MLSPGDLAKVIATTPETVSRLRGGRRPRRTNEVAVLTLHAVIDAALVAMGGDAAAVPGAIVAADAEGRVEIRTPAAPGGYRLFVTVTDGKGSGAVDNWPFRVVP